MIDADCSFSPDVDLPILHVSGGICNSFGMVAIQETGLRKVPGCSCEGISTMAIQSWLLSPWAAVRILAAGTVAAVAFACVAGENSRQMVIDVPIETVCLQPHPRPVFVPVPESNAVELTGTIEFCQMPRQPRPLSAPPRRIDILASSLTHVNE